MENKYIQLLTSEELCAIEKAFFLIYNSFTTQIKVSFEFDRIRTTVLLCP